MFALLILPVLISGSFFYSSKLNIKYYYQLNRLDGQLLYLKVASVGLIFMFLSLVIAFVFKFIFPSLKLVTLISENFSIYRDPKSNRVAIWLLLLSTLSIILSIFVPIFGVIKERVVVKLLTYMFNKLGSTQLEVEAVKKARNLRVIKDTLPNSSIKYFLLNAVSKKKLIMLSLSSRKVYVGYVEELSDPNEKRSLGEQVSMVMLLSGYRDKDDLSITFLNEYSNINPENSFVIFNRDDIEMISFFDIDTYIKVNKSLAITE